MRQLSDFGTTQRKQGFQFNDDVRMAEEIRPVVSAELYTAVPNRNRKFANVRNAVRGQFELKRVLIGGLQEAGPQFAMDPHGGTNDAERPRISFLVDHTNRILCSVLKHGAG